MSVWTDGRATLVPCATDDDPEVDSGPLRLPSRGRCKRRLFRFGSPAAEVGTRCYPGLRLGRRRDVACRLAEWQRHRGPARTLVPRRRPSKVEAVPLCAPSGTTEPLSAVQGPGGCPIRGGRDACHSGGSEGAGFARVRSPSGVRRHEDLSGFQWRALRGVHQCRVAVCGRFLGRRSSLPLLGRLRRWRETAADSHPLRSSLPDVSRGQSPGPWRRHVGFPSLGRPLPGDYRTRPGASPGGGPASSLCSMREA